jgi:hypothetical protein
MDKGNLNTDFDPISSYDKRSLTKIVYVSDVKTVGKIYTFRFRAKNIIGTQNFLMWFASRFRK